mmetsp:Transcript_2289/g.4808  ORF Transcript_2289/g.4808 Transcript_2289/m.4808 type:complete len:172 (-) Transcript_2289:98-613(-)
MLYVCADAFHRTVWLDGAQNNTKLHPLTRRLNCTVLHLIITNISCKSARHNPVCSTGPESAQLFTMSSGDKPTQQNWVLCCLSFDIVCWCLSQRDRPFGTVLDDFWKTHALIDFANCGTWGTSTNPSISTGIAFVCPKLAIERLRCIEAYRAHTPTTTLKHEGMNQLPIDL